MNIEQERAEFEAWAEQRGMEFHKVSPCDGSPPYYIDTPGSAAWEAWQARAALAAQAHDAAPQPLTDEYKAILKECRKQAMRWTVEARIPEAGEFGRIAQDLDYLCGQLVVEEQEKADD